MALVLLEVEQVRAVLVESKDRRGNGLVVVEDAFGRGERAALPHGNGGPALGGRRVRGRGRSRRDRDGEGDGEKERRLVEHDNDWVDSERKTEEAGDEVLLVRSIYRIRATPRSPPKG